MDYTVPTNRMFIGKAKTTNRENVKNLKAVMSFIEEHNIDFSYDDTKQAWTAKVSKKAVHD